MHSRDSVLRQNIHEFQKLVQSGLYMDAWRLYMPGIRHEAYWVQGDGATCLGLLRSLFPDGEDAPPGVPNPRVQMAIRAELAIAHSHVGHCQRAAALAGAVCRQAEELGEWGMLRCNLCNMSDDLLNLGRCGEAETALQRCIALSRKTGGSSLEVLGLLELARLQCYVDPARVPDTLTEAEQATEKLVCCHPDTRDLISAKTLAALALHQLLAADTGAAVEIARRGWAHSRKCPNCRCAIRARKLLSQAIVARAEQRRHERSATHLAEANAHAVEALRLARATVCRDYEPSIRLHLARLLRLRGDGSAAREEAMRALLRARRCEHRLDQAEIWNFLADLSLEQGDRKGAVSSARAAWDAARCDGRPYVVALEEAQGLLARCGIKKS